MSLGAKQGESLILTADGPDEKLAMGYLSGDFENDFVICFK